MDLAARPSRKSLEVIGSAGFGEYLIARGALDEEQLLDVLAEHWQRRAPLAESIVERGYVPRERLERLADEFDRLHVVYV